MQACLSLNFKLKRLLPCEPDACIKPKLPETSSGRS